MTETDDIDLTLLLEAIYLRYHHDFRGYARASMRRRMSAAIAALRCENLSALQGKILSDPRAFSELLRFLTVQVSDMVRDPLFFRVLREEIVPVLHTYPRPRLWIAGCSTGEEVYSIAILLQECGLLDRATIYATAINAEALEKAEAGIYPLERIPVFTENHRLSGGTLSLSHYYTARYGAAVFDRALRKNVVFSDHSLATDSVFAEVQVVTCRNVLIYFDRALQARAVALMRDALSPRGFLGLGSKESLQFSPHAASFRPINLEARWYQRT